MRWSSISHDVLKRNERFFGKGYVIGELKHGNEDRISPIIAYQGDDDFGLIHILKHDNQYKRHFDTELSYLWNVTQNHNDKVYNPEKGKTYLFLRNENEERHQGSIPTAILGTQKEEDHHRLISSFYFTARQAEKEKKAGEEVYLPSSADSEIRSNQELHNHSTVDLVKNDHRCKTAPAQTENNTPYHFLKEAPDYFKDAMRNANRLSCLAQDASPISLLTKVMGLLTKKWTDAWNKKAFEIAKKFVFSGEKHSSRQFQQALNKNGFTVKFQTTPEVQSSFVWRKRQNSI